MSERAAGRVNRMWLVGFTVSSGLSRRHARLLTSVLLISMLLLAADLPARSLDSATASSLTYDGHGPGQVGTPISTVDLGVRLGLAPIGDMGYVYDSPLSFVATNTADDLLPGLPSTAPKPAGLGSTGRVTPSNLTEQLVMEQIRQQIIQGRFGHLEHEMATFADQIRKILGGG